MNELSENPDVPDVMNAHLCFVRRYGLTPREVEILESLCGGKSNDEIAALKILVRRQ